MWRTILLAFAYNVTLKHFIKNLVFNKFIVTLNYSLIIVLAFLTSIVSALCLFKQFRKLQLVFHVYVVVLSVMCDGDSHVYMSLYPMQWVSRYKPIIHFTLFYITQKGTKSLSISCCEMSPSIKQHLLHRHIEDLHRSC